MRTNLVIGSKARFSFAALEFVRVCNKPIVTHLAVS